MMKKHLLAALMGAGLAFGFAAQGLAADNLLHAKLIDANGKETGVAEVQGTDKGVLISVSAEGLSPGWHGVHFHGTGDCSDHTDHFKKSGGHMNKEGQAHGYLDAKGPHLGDLPNMWIGKDGTGKADFFTDAISLNALADKDGAALMIHAGADDYKGQPAGNSGGRVACGVLGQ